MKIKPAITWILILLLSTSCSLLNNTQIIPTYTAIPISEAAPEQPEIDPAADTDEEIAVTPAEESSTRTYPIVDSAQSSCYSPEGRVISCPAPGEEGCGQDAQYTGNVPDYTDNGDGTVTDNVTGLMWQQSPDLNGDGQITAADKLSYSEALAGADTFSLAGYTDWRLPSIKELYSLILFDGTDPSGLAEGTSEELIPFLDNSTFDFGYGDADAGERILDAQFASSTAYVSTTMNNAETMFGVNFADGRIKGYPIGSMPGQAGEKKFYVLYVRGNTDYGVNQFVDNGDGTISDHATGLMWQRDDSGQPMDWMEALAWVRQKNSENHLGFSDWRLPNAKELQSIVDYSRSPDTTGSAAINPLFYASPMTNEAGQADFGFYWSSSTHASSYDGRSSAYVAFGRALGYMNGQWMDVHGAGAQRSDPKTGDPSQFPTGFGPQGDAIRIHNYVRLVRGGDISSTPQGGPGLERSSITVQSTGTILGEESDPQQDGPTGGIPPQEALDACAGIESQAVCSFNTPNGTIQGTCLPVEGQLACVPGDSSP